MKGYEGAKNCILAALLCVPLLCGCSGQEGLTLYDSRNYDIVTLEEGSFSKGDEEEISNPGVLAGVRNGARESQKALFIRGAGVFSWDHLPTIKDIQCMQDNFISEVYQYIRPDYTEDEIRDFLVAMSEVDIDVYILDGEAEWSYRRNYDGMKGVLDRVRYYNSLVGPTDRIKGIVYDVEPYVLDKWHNTPDDLLEEYTDNIIRIREECSGDEDHIDICVCIPFSYDNMGYDRRMRNIIREADQIFVLNYLKGREIENVKREAALCRWYRKRMVNVYELQPGLLSQTTNTITYYKDGLDAVKLNYKELMDAYPSHDIAIGYHTLEYLRVLSLEK